MNVSVSFERAVLALYPGEVNRPTRGHIWDLGRILMMLELA
jgi:hypothetical protein